VPIRILPTLLVNKIAAGEVVERPASVVKELVENALDAGATRIEIAVEDGGRGLISVADDGAGMDAEDLKLAFLPHATSKIADEDDLWNIQTLGFRGEALAAIASVSQAHIRACRRDAAQAGGYEIEAAGPAVAAVRPCAAPPGATVSVRNLFFNTPARRKFLRSAGTELGHVSEALARLALPHPQVAFRLTHNGRAIQSLRAVESTLARVCDLLGQEFRDVLLSVPSRPGPVQVAGLIGAPSAARTTNRWQYFFLNGRYIRDRLLLHALREAYRGLADPSRYPVAFLFLQIAPSEVDVNVHPTKIEVRFRDSQAVYAQVLACLRETLNRTDLAPAAQLSDESYVSTSQTHSLVSAAADGLPPPAPTGPSAPPTDEATEQRRASLRQAMADFFRSQPPPQPRFAFGGASPSETRTAPGSHAAVQHASASPSTAPLPGASMAPSSGATESPVHRTEMPSQDSQAQSIAAWQSASAPASGAMQIHNSYIVAAGDDGLIIIDQHALHERILYNEFRRRLAAGRLESQRLLIPAVVNVTEAEASLLLAQAPLLERLGIELAGFGPARLAVQQFPALLVERNVEPVAFVRELADRLADNEQAGPEQLLESLLEMLACRAAVKAGQPLAPAEIEMLLAQREQAEKASACPHGRPTTLRLSLRDLQRQFHRG